MIEIKVSVQDAPRRARRAGLRCGSCGGDAHRAVDATTGRRWVECTHGCGWRGPWVEPGAEPEAQPPRVKGKTGGTRCTECGRRGHNVRNCPGDLGAGCETCGRWHPGRMCPESPAEGAGRDTVTAAQEVDHGS